MRAIHLYHRLVGSLVGWAGRVGSFILLFIVFLCLSLWECSMLSAHTIFFFWITTYSIWIRLEQRSQDSRDTRIDQRLEYNFQSTCLQIKYYYDDESIWCYASGIFISFLPAIHRNDYENHFCQIGNSHQTNNPVVSLFDYQFFKWSVGRYSIWIGIFSENDQENWKEEIRDTKMSEVVK